MEESGSLKLVLEWKAEYKEIETETWNKLALQMT